MRPVLTIFMDGLKASSIEHMPFLNSFAYKRRLKTILGYSVACHASMYTGVYPNRHLLWFIWQRAAKTSPFRWIKPFAKLSIADNIPGRLILHRITTLFNKNTAYFGIPRVIHLPLKYWSSIDVSEKKLWTEPQYLEAFPTLFDIMSDHHIEFEVVGMKTDPSVKDESYIVASHKYTAPRPWIYLFMGDVDHFSHKLGQDSTDSIKRLKELDHLFEEKYRNYEKLVGEFSFIVFSDHGHVKVNQKFDIYSFFENQGHRLNDFFHIIDVNYARFWFRNENERNVVKDLLSRFPHGFVLTSEVLEKYHVDIPDSRYGDLIFYLDVGHVFSRTIWGFSRGLVSMHGYIPDYPDCDGIFVSNFPIDDDIKYVKLVDILPTHLDLMGLPVPGYVEGRSVVK